MRLVFDRKHNATASDADGKRRTGLVQLEVSCGGRRAYMSSGVKLYSDQWSSNSCATGFEGANAVNAMLQNLLASASRTLAEMSKDGDVSIDNFIEAMKHESSGSNEMSLAGAIEEHIRFMSTPNARKSTLNGYASVISILNRFGGMKYISDVTPERIARFRKFITDDSGLKQSTAEMYLTRISAVLRRMVSDGKIESNPFDAYNRSRRIPPRVEKTRYLKPDEITAFEEYHPKNAQEERAMDIFLFQMYTGMSFCDAMNVNINDFENRNGKLFLCRERRKTGVEFNVLLNEKAKEILMKYGGSLPKVHLTNINKPLHQIGRELFGRNISTHDARHTFATWALRNGMRIEVLAKVLGHTNTKQTSRYAKILAEDVMSGFEALERTTAVNTGSRDEKSISARCMRLV